MTANLIALRAWQRDTGKGPADHPLYRDRRTILHVVYLGEADYQDWLSHRKEGAA